MIRRIVLSAAVVVTAFACVAPAASADPTAMKRAVSAPDYAVDGTDIYYLDQRFTKKNGIRKYMQRLVRASFLDKSKAVIAEFDEMKSGFPEAVVAGGGYVFVSFDTEDISLDPKVPTSQVLRISRDGATQQVVASGELIGDAGWGVDVEGKKVKLEDCGTSVEAMAASVTGAIVIRETTSERNSKKCGRKKNVDRNRYFELRLDGTTREIVSNQLRVVAKSKVTKGGGWEVSTNIKGSEVFGFSIVGDRVLYSYGVGGKLWVKDLATGSLAGPYLADPASSLGFQFGSIDVTGRLALFGFSAPANAKKPSDFRITSGIYATPGDAQNFTKLSSSTLYQFCGSHLIASGRTRTIELDPVTLAERRTLATYRASKSIVDVSLPCTDQYLYLSEYRRNRPDVLTAIPLN